ncbi:hypothetical protein CCS38_10920 [Streptomyces purpurogeneiscleroticus]|nr:hypothetical protein [Streptomyces purpurogeneiscleroticus]
MAGALGAEGDDLVDAERLLAVDDEDADEAQIQAAAEAPRARRPELFGEVRSLVSAAPGWGVGRAGPSRTAHAQKPGAAGLEMARSATAGPDREAHIYGNGPDMAILCGSDIRYSPRPQGWSRGAAYGLRQG